MCVQCVPGPFSPLKGLGTRLEVIILITRLLPVQEFSTCQCKLRCAVLSSSSGMLERINCSVLSDIKDWITHCTVLFIGGVISKC